VGRGDDAAVGLFDGPEEHLGVAVSSLLHHFGDGIDGQPGGALAGLGAAHSIGEDI
jgi:hypothetical protein